ncbi:Hypothetical protein J6897_01971 [Nakaseomyces glabratus]|nr:glutamyl-tRNA(Gln) amidotransferase subunit F [Nakaseomyces glabratus]
MSRFMIRAVFFRRYTAATVGKPFRNVAEVKQYLAKQTWSIDEILHGVDTGKAAKQGVPTEDEVRKLLALCAFPVEDADLQDSKRILVKQLSFINKLHETSVDDQDKNLDENYARLLPRQNKALTYDDLLKKIDDIKQDEATGEPTGSWDSTGLAKMRKDNYFIVRQGLLKNRK